MNRCDVLIVGGGPAGSSCAWRLARAGLDVVVLDRAQFPRDKVCAGWITPAAVAALELDLTEYGRGRTLQPFTGFQTGSFKRTPRVTDFGRTISYGIRRCEFDTYLLERSGARLATNQPLADLQREPEGWLVNDVIRAPIIVGAGGHFCPVARRLNHRDDREDAVVVAQEIEYRLGEAGAVACQVRGECPALFFWEDLRGYGWCVRKGDYLNVGAGRLSRSGFPAAVRDFTTMLEARGIVGDGIPRSWKGHAYLLNTTSIRRIVDEGVLLIGDAAGLALSPSGEGILAAIESGLMAADAILDAKRDYSLARLEPYARRIEQRFGQRANERASWGVPSWLVAAAGRVVLESRWLTRRVILEDGFLHVRRPMLNAN
jgi:flavin-dependent dehydrogenase